MSKKKTKYRKKKNVKVKASIQNKKRQRGNRNLYLALGTILLVTFISFLPSLNNDFVNWDDPIYITDNPLIQSLSWHNIKILFSEAVAFNYHPFTFLTLAFNYSLSGLNPWPYHLTNLIIHLANCFFVFFFIYYLVKRSVYRDESGLGIQNHFVSGIVVAFLTALLFAIHPMHVESVAWVTERKDVLYTFFFIPALIAYVFYVNEKKTKYIIYCGVLFFCSLLSKPAAITLPFCLLLIDYWFGRKFTKNVILEKIPFFFFSLLFGWITFQIQADVAVKSIEKYDIIQRLIAASVGYLTYILKSIIPINLSAFYPYPNFSAISPVYYLAIPAAVILTLGLLWFFRNKKFIIFGLLFFLFNISPVLQLVSVGGALMAERYTYVPYIGLFLIYSILFHQLSSRYKNYTLKIAAGIYMFALCFITWNQCKVWQNGETLWSSVIEKNGNRTPSIAYSLRGRFYMGNNQLDKAKTDLNKAIEINPNNVTAQMSLGFIAFESNRHDEAIDHYNIVLKNESRNVNALTNRGGCYMAKNRFEEAISDLQKALEIDPTYVKAFINIGSTYGKMGDFDAAIKYFSQGLKHDPNNPTLNLFLAYAYRDKGDTVNSQLYLNKAKQLGTTIK